MATIIGYVLRTIDPERLLDFFSCLGVSFSPEQHEGGPLHHVAPLEPGAVLEVYKRGERKYVDDMIVVQVISVKRSLAKLKKKGYLASQVPETSKNSKDALVYSPDGRQVYLMEGKGP